MTIHPFFIVLLSGFVAFFVAAEEPLNTWSNNTPLTKTLTVLNSKLTNAYQDENVSLLRTMLTKDHIHNNVFGSVMDKETFLRDIESGILVFETYKTPELRWFIKGDMAIATGLIEAKAFRGGKPVPATRFRFTRIFVQRKGQWKVLLFQNTMAPK